MDTIIGLGKAGCAIADKFAQITLNIKFLQDRFSEGCGQKGTRSCTHLLKRQGDISRGI